MMPWLKRLNMLLLLMVFSTIVMSCSQETNSRNTSVSNLTIHLMESDKVLLDAMDKLNKKNQNVKIDATVFTDIEEYKYKNTTGLLSGDGPDIIVNRLEALNNINRVASSGVFCDINQLIIKDKDFKLSDYNEKILDYGVYRGKRYLIPINYISSGMVTTQEILDKNAISFHEADLTWQDLAAVIKNFMSANKSQDKYFINYMSFTQLLGSSGNMFIDYENKKSTYESKDFIELLNLYKDIYPAICPSSISSKYSSSELLNNGTVVMASIAEICSPYNLTATNAEINRLLKQKTRIYGFPTWDKEDNTTVWPYYLLGINQKCKNSMEAFKYIKLLLSDEYQKQTGKYGFDLTWYTPVRESAYKLDKESCLKGTVYGNVPLPNYLAQEMERIRGNIGVGKLYESEVYEIIEKELPAFLNGSKSAIETAKIINQKITIYLNE